MVPILAFRSNSGTAVTAESVGTTVILCMRDSTGSRAVSGYSFKGTTVTEMMGESSRLYEGRNDGWLPENREPSE
jgi:hypothetical protein